MKKKIRTVSVFLALMSFSAMAQSSEGGWELVFSDPGAGDWQEHWFVEGKKVTVSSPRVRINATHLVVPSQAQVRWTPCPNR